MRQREITPARLESFSDAVVAIIVTVMVLELRPPAQTTWRALTALWPDVLSYVVSFWTVVIYWVNHHYVLKRAQVLTEPILWANISLLFFLSLIPFTTAFVGRSHVAGFPVALYAMLVGICGLNFWILRRQIARGIDDPEERRVFDGPKVQIVGAATLAMLLASIALSFVSPLAALFLVGVSSTLHAGRFTRP